MLNECGSGCSAPARNLENEWRSVEVGRSDSKAHIKDPTIFFLYRFWQGRTWTLTAFLPS